LLFWKDVIPLAIPLLLALVFMEGFGNISQIAENVTAP
jgi:hypothetical protein